MKARIEVSAARDHGDSSARGRRQQIQSAGSNANPLETKCSLMSKRPSVCQCPPRSKPGLMSTRKYKYTTPPSSAETAYITTTALANEADRTARKRPKNEPGRPCAPAHVANVWWVIAPSSATATKP